VRTVLANVRFYPVDASDVALNKRCTVEEIEKNYAQFGPVSFSLVQRPAFRAAVPPINRLISRPISRLISRS